MIIITIIIVIITIIDVVVVIIFIIIISIIFIFGITIIDFVIVTPATEQVPLLPSDLCLPTLGPSCCQITRLCGLIP